MADPESPLGELGPVERMRGGEERETEREVNEQRLDKTGKETGKNAREKGKKIETERSRDTSGGSSALVWGNPMGELALILEREKGR